MRSWTFSNGADHEGQNFAEWMKRYSAYFSAGESYARGYSRIAREFPQHVRQLEEIVLPIQHEIFGTEKPRGGWSKSARSKWSPYRANACWIKATCSRNF
jgi:hypothetical protein